MQQCFLKGFIMSINSVKEVLPSGSQLLVDLIDPKELVDTVLYLKENYGKNEPPQAYILKTGPMVSPEYGFKEGMRVVLVGNYTPMPKIGKEKLAVVEPHCIKAILVENDK